MNLTADQTARLHSRLAVMLRAIIATWSDRAVLAAVAYTTASRALMRSAASLDSGEPEPTADERANVETLNSKATAYTSATRAVESALAYYIAHGGAPQVMWTPATPDASELRRLSAEACEQAAHDVSEVVARHDANVERARAEDGAQDAIDATALGYMLPDVYSAGRAGTPSQVRAGLVQADIIAALDAGEGGEAIPDVATHTLSPLALDPLPRGPEPIPHGVTERADVCPPSPRPRSPFGEF